jgi:hypothetical protein
MHPQQHHHHQQSYMDALLSSFEEASVKSLSSLTDENVLLQHQHQQLNEQRNLREYNRLVSNAPHAVYIYTILHSLPPPTKQIIVSGDNDSNTITCEYVTMKSSRVVDKLTHVVKGSGTGFSVTKATVNAACDVLIRLYPHLDSVSDIMMFLDKKLAASTLKLRPILPRSNNLISSFDYEQDASILLNEICQQ